MAEGIYQWHVSLDPQNIARRCLVSEQVAGAGATVTQSCEQLETEHLGGLPGGPEALKVCRGQNGG